MIMRSLKPEFLNALDNFIAARHEVEIGGELYTIIAKLDDYTGTRWSSSRDTDGFPEN